MSRVVAAELREVTPFHDPQGRGGTRTEGLMEEEPKGIGHRSSLMITGVAFSWRRGGRETIG